MVGKGLVEKPNLTDASGRDSVAGVGPLAGHALGHQPAQALQRADVGRHGDVDLLNADEAVLGAIAAIGRRDHVDGAPDTAALHRCEHGKPGVRQGGEAALEVLHHEPQACVAAPLLGHARRTTKAALGEHRQVHSGREVLAGRRQHHHAGGACGIEPLHDGGELGPERRDHRVVGLRTVQPDVGDPVAQIDVEALPGRVGRGHRALGRILRDIGAHGLLL